MLFEKGRICIKVAGREAGKYCVVVEEGKKFVTVSGPKSLTGVKRRRCNTNHLEPTPEKIDIKGGSDEEILEALKSSGLIEKIGMKKG